MATGRVIHDPSASLKGKLLPTNEKHLPSITDPKEFGALLRAIDAYVGSHTVRSALRLAPMVFVRHFELRAAEWSEINFDTQDHVGRIWLTFFRGRVPTQTERFREDAMREIMKHWPDTLSLPIMPTGAIPLAQDLVRTPNGYIVTPSEAKRYQLPAPR